MKSGTPQIQIETITPDLAREYLGFNTHNRNTRGRVVTAYATDMTNGDWVWNGEAIKFDKDGNLHDGQHRLMAIIESGVTVKMLVVRGLAPEAQETMDGGPKRTFSDALKLRGELNYVSLAATIRAIAAYEAGRGGYISMDRKHTNAQLSQLLEKYPWIREGMSVCRGAQTHLSMPTSVSGLTWFLFTQLDEEDTDHFFKRLCSDENHQAGDPIYTLRRLLLISVDARGARNVRYLTAVTIKAWNKYRRGERCEQLMFRTGGARPEAFPIPE